MVWYVWVYVVGGGGVCIVCVCGACVVSCRVVSCVLCLVSCVLCFVFCVLNCGVPCCVVVCECWCWCWCTMCVLSLCVVLRVCVWCVARLNTRTTTPCVDSKRLRVHDQDVSVCNSKTPAC